MNNVKKLESRSAKIDEFRGTYGGKLDSIGANIRQHILSLNIEQLVYEISSARNITAEQVVLVYCEQARLAHEQTNCLTEILFKEALMRAKHLDEHLTRTDNALGAFHGVPFSIKDTFDLAGSGNTNCSIIIAIA